MMLPPTTMPANSSSNECLARTIRRALIARVISRKLKSIAPLVESYLLIVGVGRGCSDPGRTRSCVCLQTPSAFGFEQDNKQHDGEKLENAMGLESQRSYLPNYFSRHFRSIGKRCSLFSADLHLLRRTPSASGNERNRNASSPDRSARAPAEIDRRDHGSDDRLMIASYLRCSVPEVYFHQRE